MGVFFLRPTLEILECDFLKSILTLPVHVEYLGKHKQSLYDYKHSQFLVDRCGFH